MSVVAKPVLLPTRSYATLSARHRDGGSRGVLELSGEADIATLFLLGDDLAEAVRLHPDHLVVDVSELRFCDVHSAHMILTASRMSPITVTGATGSVKRVFDLLAVWQRGAAGTRRLTGPWPTTEPPVRARPTWSAVDGDRAR